MTYRQMELPIVHQPRPERALTTAAQQCIARDIDGDWHSGETSEQIDYLIARTNRYSLPIVMQLAAELTGGYR